MKFFLKTYQMINDMTARCVPSSIAKPLLAQVAHDHTVGFVYATVLASIVRQFLAIKFFILFFKLKFS